MKFGSRKHRMRRFLKLLIIVIAVIAILAAGIYILEYMGIFKTAPETNAKSGASEDYTYITTYGPSASFNKFTVNITGVDGNKVSFSYRQTVADNATSNLKLNNYSLAFDPTISKTYSAGSELPLFVANNLASGNGTATVTPAGATSPVPINYSVVMSSGRVQISLQYYSGLRQQSAFIKWILLYNETTGFLETGFIAVISTVFAYTAFNYTMTSFRE